MEIPENVRRTSFWHQKLRSDVFPRNKVVFPYFVFSEKGGVLTQERII